MTTGAAPQPARILVVAEDALLRALLERVLLAAGHAFRGLAPAGDLDGVVRRGIWDEPRIFAEVDAAAEGSSAEADRSTLFALVASAMATSGLESSAIRAPTL